MAGRRSPRGRRRRRWLGPLGRVGLAAALKGMGTLVRRHPRAAVEALAAGAAAAARSALSEVQAAVEAPRGRRADPSRRRRVRGLTKPERRRLREFLDGAARRERANRRRRRGDVASR
jgi:hypothetical protein